MSKTASTQAQLTHKKDDKDPFHKKQQIAKCDDKPPKKEDDK